MKHRQKMDKLDVEITSKSFTGPQKSAELVCGICSIGHTLASLKATEDAMGLSISDQSRDLRRLALHAENMQSHILHVGYLVVPDLFGAQPLAQEFHRHKAVHDRRTDDDRKRVRRTDLDLGEEGENLFEKAS
jgi:hypothetical protein